MDNTFNAEDYEYAGFGIRLIASLIDSLLLALITLPAMSFAYSSYWETDQFVLGPLDIIINYIFPFIVIILFWIYKGATPGKMALKLTIVDEKTGEKPTVGQSIGRYFAYILATIPLFLGFFWIIWDNKKQGWHDKLAKTVVIRKIKNEKVSFSHKEE